MAFTISVFQCLLKRLMSYTEIRKAKQAYGRFERALNEFRKRFKHVLTTERASNAFATPSEHVQDTFRMRSRSRPERVRKTSRTRRERIRNVSRTHPERIRNDSGTRLFMFLLNNDTNCQTLHWLLLNTLRTRSQHL